MGTISDYFDQDTVTRHINFTLGHWNNGHQSNFLHEWILNLDIAFSKKTNWFSVAGNIERIARNTSLTSDAVPSSDWMVSSTTIKIKHFF